MLALFGVKGGVGTTTVAALVALAGRECGPTRLVDFVGDLAPMLSVEQPDVGVADWLGGGGDTPLDALGRLAVPVTAGVELIGPGSGSIASQSLGALGWLKALGSLKALGDQLASLPGEVVVDGGLADGGVLAHVLRWPDTRVAVVLRPSFVAVDRARRLLGGELASVRPHAVVVGETGALSSRDIRSALDAEVTWIPFDTRVSRLADAGLLTTRLPNRVLAAVRDL